VYACMHCIACLCFTLATAIVAACAVAALTVSDSQFARTQHCDIERAFHQPHVHIALPQLLGKSRAVLQLQCRECSSSYLCDGVSTVEVCVVLSQHYVVIA
jgi:hypothetical protein